MSPASGDDELDSSLKARSRSDGVSMSELIRRTLQAHVQPSPLADAPARAAGLYADAFGKSHQGIALEDFLLAAAAKQNHCPLWTGNRKHYPMEDIQLFSA